MEALPILARGSALRFMLTRLVDWLNVPPGALVEPKTRANTSASCAFTRRRGAPPTTVFAVTDRVLIWTDGGCIGNPGPGGWGAILKFGEREKEVSGGEPPTTNNRMELSAAIFALEALKRPCRVVLHTDSQYLRNGISSWIKTWKRTAGAPPKGARSRTRTFGADLDKPGERHEIEWRLGQRPCRRSDERTRR